jgi:hypothetical protein
MGDVAYINKNLVSWADLRWWIGLPDLGNAGKRFYGFHSIDFGSQKRERPPQWGQNRSQAPIGLPSGKYTPPNPKVGFLAHALDADATAPFDSLITTLMQASEDGRSYGNVRMNWTLQVINRGIYAQYDWFDVYIVGDNGAWEESPDGLKREIECTCTRFRTNGGTLYDSSEE